MITSGASLARHGRMKDHPGGSGANAIDKAMKEPRDFARDAGRFAIPDGSGDRFSGYAVIGLPFSSGHILALRCFEASSLGAYTSVWHRDPKGRWTFHQNVPPEQSCPRYFGAAISENTIEAIRIEWRDQRGFCVTVDAPGEIIWEIRLAPTPATKMMNRAASAMLLRGGGSGPYFSQWRPRHDGCWEPAI